MSCELVVADEAILTVDGLVVVLVVEWKTTVRIGKKRLSISRKISTNMAILKGSKKRKYYLIIRAKNLGKTRGREKMGMDSPNLSHYLTILDLFHRFHQGYFLSIELEFMKMILQKILESEKMSTADNQEEGNITGEMNIGSEIKPNERLIQRVSLILEKIESVPMEVIILPSDPRASPPHLISVIE